MSGNREHENGQALVQVALALVVLFGFLALAVDVSQVYLKRRQLQNAADAGALEGARQMCFEKQTYDQAKTPATTTALANAPAASVGFPATATAYQMTVVVSQTIPSFAASIVGQNQFNPGARATAVCGAADTVCGLFPVAFKQSQWEVLQNACPSEPVFYVWASDKDDAKKQPNCKDPTHPELECNCDMDGNPGDEVISEAGRAWLDLTSTAAPSDPYADFCGGSNGCGASELKCWINSSSSVRITLPACISGDTGVKAGVQKDIEKRAALPPPGNIVSVPIYDKLCSTGTGGGCTSKYNVVGLGCIKIIGWDNNVKLPYKLDPTNKSCWNGKLIMVQAKCSGCTTSCGSTGGTPPIPGGVNAVSLIE